MLPQPHLHLIAAALQLNSAYYMAILIAILLVLLALVALRGLAQFSQIRTMPMYLLVPLWLSLYLPMSTIVLVPVDLIPGNFGLSERVRQVLWRVIYWMAFFLSWIILPSLQYYVESGYHDPMVRLRDALKANLRYQLILAASATVGLLYMGLSVGLSFTNLRGLAIALSYSYALVVAIWLLGHGLVTVPRNIFAERDPQQQLEALYVHSVACHDTYDDALSNYKEVAEQVRKLSPPRDHQHREWIDQLKEDVENSSLSIGRSPRSNHSSTIDLNEDSLAALSKRLQRDHGRAVRHKAEWARLVKEAIFLEDVIAAKQSGHLTFRNYKPSLSQRFCFPYYVIMRPWLSQILATVAILLTFLILQSELWLGTSWAFVDILIRSSSGLLQLSLACTILGYMCASTGYALSSIKVFHIYGLVHGDTDYSSLTFYAMYACRLAVPLSYNFLAMNTGHISTVFQKLLGSSINLTPLGRYFDTLLPRLVVVPMLFAFFKLYDKVKDYLGFGISDFGDDETGHATISEGKQMILRASQDPSLGLELRSESGPESV